MSSMMANMMLVVVPSLLMYAIAAALSWLLFHAHESNLVSNYAKHSLAMAISQYIWPIAGWGLLALIFVYLKLGGYDA